MVTVMIVAPVGDDPIGPLTRPPDLAWNGRDAVEEREQLGNVVAVPARQRDRQGLRAATP